MKLNYSAPVTAINKTNKCKINLTLHIKIIRITKTENMFCKSFNNVVYSTLYIYICNFKKKFSKTRLRTDGRSYTWNSCVLSSIYVF